MKTKLTIKWRYENEIEIHSHTYHDIKPESISIHYDYLWFCSDENPDGWSFALSMIYSIEQEVEQ